MDPVWCYACHIDASGISAPGAWGLSTADHEPDLRVRGPMHPDQADELRFLCAEFGAEFDGTLSEGQAAIVIHSFLDEPATDAQTRSLAWLSERLGSPMEDGLTYGKARSAIRRAIALRGLRSA